ncbi:glycosyltransferase [Ochrobactrum sp. A-1]|uniref:glycosyltransferase n=1 Tax=Ochrobactrum sp. A-1 TaxID=2920940 RepID=UPI001F0B6657|nr:glycosyltransferase [Ochrobactrum sp. A-1]
MADPVWFWQRIVSPHMAVLASALAARGREVTYVAEREMSAERAAQGWIAPSLGKAELRLTPSVDEVMRAVQAAPTDSIHICQGLRGNGLVGEAQKLLAARGLRQWGILETIEDSGWRGIFKRMEYRRLIYQAGRRLEGILAIGDGTARWLVDRGMPQERVFPFAYFLPEGDVLDSTDFDPAIPFRFLYVGRLIELKRVDLLIDALATISGHDFELIVVGSGPLEAALSAQAEEKLPGRVRWVGRQPIDKIPEIMASADCLVLPSRYDGWGAVVSESLMTGTPVICSDACGSAVAVRASGLGGVFRTGDVLSLRGSLWRSLEAGRQISSSRHSLAAWAQCLGARSGAEYLDQILAYSVGGPVSKTLVAPWQRAVELLEVCR